MNTSEFVELATLVVTIISTIMVPFLQRPILSYTNPTDLIHSNNNTTKISMSVSNQDCTCRKRGCFPFLEEKMVEYKRNRKDSS